MSVINQNGLLGIASITSSGTNVQLFNSSGGAGTLTIGTGTTITSSAITVNGSNIPTEGGLSNRNIIINGSMVVNQRGWTGAAGTSTDAAYTTDRFRIDRSHDGVISAGQTSMNSTVGGNAYADGFQNALILRVTTADATLGAAQYQLIGQRIEGYNLQGIKKGTVNAQPVTLSFWCRSTTTGTYIVEMYDNDNTRQVSQSYTINVANTWEKKTLTFPADTTGAFDDDNNNSLSLQWWFAAGSNYSGGTLNTSWAAVVDNKRAVGQTNLLATAGNDFFLTGVQLEVGSAATPFERRSYGQELALCQRYFEKVRLNGLLTNYIGGGYNIHFGSINYRVTKRTNAPIQGISNPSIGNYQPGGGSGTAVATNFSDSGCRVSSGSTNTTFPTQFINDGGSAWIGIDAEL